MELITKWEDGDTEVTWHASDKGHVITYGLDVEIFSNDLAASHRFGECIRHSLACAGRFNYGDFTT